MGGGGGEGSKMLQGMLHVCSAYESHALTMGRKASAAPFTVAMYFTSGEPWVCWAQTTDILFRLLEKWNRWIILSACFLSLREQTESSVYVQGAHGTHIAGMDSLYRMQ